MRKWVHTTRTPSGHGHDAKIATIAMRSSPKIAGVELELWPSVAGGCRLRTYVMFACSGDSGSSHKEAITSAKMISTCRRASLGLGLNYQVRKNATGDSESVNRCMGTRTRSISGENETLCHVVISLPIVRLPKSRHLNNANFVFTD